jgi:mono/diheme cytochrome c family protein
MRTLLLFTLIAAGCGDSSPSFAPTANAVRGLYLIQNVLACGDCHTTPDKNGLPSFNPADFLAGGRGFDIINGKQVFASNLTADKQTGLGSWSDDEIKTAIRDGKDKEGHALNPVMPYFAFHNISDDDIHAIILALRQLPATSNQVPENTFTVEVQANPINADSIPHTTLPSSDKSYASAERGRYLAGLTGACITCHTPETAPIDPSMPLDISRAFSGGQLFNLGPLQTVSANLTPDPTGLAGWSAQDIITTIQQNREKGTGRPLCPPMPGGVFRDGDMTPADLADIANYLTTLPAAKHGPFGCTDAGTPYGLDAL